MALAIGKAALGTERKPNKRSELLAAVMVFRVDD
jgi:hypothetical protein